MTVSRLLRRRLVPASLLLAVVLAGPELGVLLNHRRSGLGALDTVISTQLIRRRLQAAMISLLASITELCRDSFGRPVPILIHGYEHVRYVRVAGALSSSADYQKDWADELHPSPRGFRKVAELFDAVLRELP